MSNAAIVVEDLSKLYHIGALREPYRNLRDSLANLATAPFRRARAALQRAPRVTGSTNTIWALKDISFEIPHGAVVGVIGRNGAGKSTLLRILSRITGPTEGFAEIRGRVGSLLEVGTGFHPELSGRQNIYLNGAILGMRRTEIERKFDEIVAFAETEKFLDTPVKHYSTGMYLRLAFAVAAHLDPEILLVDEVLAVGDAAFQNKCIGKMGKVAKEGRTVLFVSHNMAAVQSLCDRCIFLEAGQIKSVGSLERGIRAYYQGIGDTTDSLGAGREVSISNLRVNGQTAPHVQSDESLLFQFDLGIYSSISGFRMFVILENSQGTTILHSVIDDRRLKDLTKMGRYSISLTVPPPWLTPGMYSVHAKLISNTVSLRGRYLSDKVLLMVDSSYDPESVPGILSPPVTWRVQSVRSD